MTSSGKCLVSKDVTIEILLRLHVKSLIRFRCVCKYWYALIRNSTFVNKHLHHPNNNSRLLVKHHNYNTEKYVFALFPDETLSSLPYTYHDINDLQMPCDLESVMGPFGGIFCLFCSWPRHCMALWNPATKEFRSLTLPHPNFPPHFMAYKNRLGFGLDPITNDYKVVWMRQYWDEQEDNPYYPKVIAVYTLGTDSWRLFETHHIGSVDDPSCNTYVNGIYYWTCCVYNSPNYTLLSFDMSTENFKEEIPVPPNLFTPLFGHLTMYNDSIAMIIYDPSYHVVEKYIYIWLMEVEGYWTKHLVIGPLLGIHSPPAIWKNDYLFLESDTEHLLLYDHTTQENKNLGPRGKKGCLEVYSYKESLVSVKGRNQCKEGGNLSILDQVQSFFTNLFDEEYQTTEES